MRSDRTARPTALVLRALRLGDLLLPPLAVPPTAPGAVVVHPGAAYPARRWPVGRTDLTQLAALVCHAALVLCGDTGLGHLASAYRTPSVLLFGPTPPSRWGPPRGPHTVLWRGAGVGDPWAGQPDPALLDLGIDEVGTCCFSTIEAASVRRSGVPPSEPSAPRGTPR